VPTATFSGRSNLTIVLEHCASALRAQLGKLMSQMDDPEQVSRDPPLIVRNPIYSGIRIARHTPSHMRARLVRSSTALLGVVAAAAIATFAGLSISARPAAASMRSGALIAASTTAATGPITPAGKQLDWVLAALGQLPLSTQEITAHFDAAFLAQVDPARINQGLEALDSTKAAVNLVQLTVVEMSSLEVLVQIGSSQFSVVLNVDASGLISGLRFLPNNQASAPCADHRATNPCSTALQLQEAYDLKSLYAKGLDGSGITIAVLAVTSSPTLVHDLAVFDKAFHLQKPSIRIISTNGKKAPVNTAVSGAQGELTLDTEAAHAIAPGAKIVVLVAPLGAITSNASDVAWQASAVHYVAHHHLGQVITSSLGSVGEAGLGASTIDQLHKDYQYAATHHVTIVQASGDFGASSREPLVGEFAERMRGYPASDPLVTAVGGTRLHLDARGNRLSPDTVFDDSNANGPNLALASGGGLSEVFTRPSYQDAVESVVGDHRGGPDVSMSGDLYGGLEIYFGGWGDAGGTSEAAPLFAGIAAIADQAAGRSLGPLNPYLYRAYQLPGHGGLVPVTAGNTTIRVDSASGAPVTVPGYDAKPGYNLATGLGTVDAAKLIRTLTQLARK
jgi:subtilase family serine protease